MKWQMLMEVGVEDINKVEAGGYGWAEGTRVADMGEGWGCGWKIQNMSYFFEMRRVERVFRNGENYYFTNYAYL